MNKSYFGGQPFATFMRQPARRYFKLPRLPILLIESLDRPTAERLRAYTPLPDVGQHAADLLFMPASPGAWAAEMIEDLLPEALIACGWFARRPNRRWRLIARINTPGAPVIALKTERLEVPYTLVAEGDRPRSSCVWLFLHDLETRNRIAAFNGALVVTETVLQAVAWRLMGLAACPISDLGGRSDRHYQRVAALMAVPRRVEFHTVDETREPPKRRRKSQLKTARRTARSTFLVVPTWDPVTLQYIDPASVGRLVTLATLIKRQAERYYPSVRLWYPSAQQLETIRRAIHHAERGELPGVLKASLQGDAKGKSKEYFKRHAVPTLMDPARAGESLATLTGQLVTAAHGDGVYDGLQTQDIEQKLLNWTQRRLILPLRQAAACLVPGGDAQRCDQLADMAETIQQARTEQIKASARSALSARNQVIQRWLQLHAKKLRIVSGMHALQAAPPPAGNCV